MRVGLEGVGGRWWLRVAGYEVRSVISHSDYWFTSARRMGLRMAPSAVFSLYKALYNMT